MFISLIVVRHEKAKSRGKKFNMGREVKFNMGRGYTGLNTG